MQVRSRVKPLESREGSSSKKDKRALYTKPESVKTQGGIVPSMTASVSIKLNSQFSTV